MFIFKYLFSKKKKNSNGLLTPTVETIDKKSSKNLNEIYFASTQVNSGLLKFNLNRVRRMSIASLYIYVNPVITKINCLCRKQHRFPFAFIFIERIKCSYFIYVKFFSNDNKPEDCLTKTEADSHGDTIFAFLASYNLSF
jgi:hypothetical protein